MKEHLSKHHKIPRCFLKVFPQSKELKKAIKSPSNIQLLTRAEHREADKYTPEIFQLLKKTFKGKKIKESVIFRSSNQAT